tara:strand:- start:51 stop:503 length:453 start_codon:yes stop_codon:yes gene_type:complete
MTKWARMRRRKERKRDESLGIANTEGKEAKLAELKKTSEDIQHSQEIEKFESAKTSKPKTILAQIPRYAYLLGFFVLLAGIFSPLIIPNIPFDKTIAGTAVLFLGLVGGILLFKATTSDNRRGIFITIGFALISISLALIYLLQGSPLVR